MWIAVLVSGAIAGVLSLGAAGRVDTQKGEPLPQSVPFASTRSAALGSPAAAAWFRGPIAVQAASRMSITVPQEDAELSINGEVRAGSGVVRDVVVAGRAPAAVEVHLLVVSWQPNNYTVLTRRATIRVAAGESVDVDLSKDRPGDGAHVRYVPTPSYIVAEMIDLAGVTKNDVVFEPGCGDARLTIAAVKAGAKRGVGIDLDAERVAESVSRVAAAGLGTRIEIRQGDALAIPDLSEASLVFLYMGEEFNQLIRPILKKQLRVGARVVSHRFTMGDWTPDRTVSLPDEGGEVLLHLWTISAAAKAAQR